MFVSSIDGSSRLHPPPPFRLLKNPIHHTPYTIHHTPYTIHHTPYTIHHTPYTIHHTPYTIHHTPYTIHHTPYTIHHTPYTINNKPYTIHHTDYKVSSGGPEKGIYLTCLASQGPGQLGSSSRSPWHPGRCFSVGSHLPTELHSISLPPLFPSCLSWPIGGPILPLLPGSAHGKWKDLFLLPLTLMLTLPLASSKLPPAEAW